MSDISVINEMNPNDFEILGGIEQWACLLFFKLDYFCNVTVHQIGTLSNQYFQLASPGWGFSIRILWFG
jgi:hypothetical protein